MKRCFLCGVPWHPSSGFVWGSQDTPVCKSCATGFLRWLSGFSHGKGRRRGGPFFYEHNCSRG